MSITHIQLNKKKKQPLTHNCILVCVYIYLHQITYRLLGNGFIHQQQNTNSKYPNDYI